MIPYDDLVAALTAWRTRQGLPVAPPVATAAAAAAAPAAPPPRGQPAPPPARSAAAAPRPAAPPPPPADAGDFEDGALVEDSSYDAGEDYVMQLGGEPAEATAIGAAPEPPSPRRGKRDGW